MENKKTSYQKLHNKNKTPKLIILISDLNRNKNKMPFGHRKL